MENFKFNKKRDYSKSRLLTLVWGGEYTVAIHHPKKSPRGRCFNEPVKTFNNEEAAEIFINEFSEKYNIKISGK